MFCTNSEENAGAEFSQCALCRFSPENIDKPYPSYWKPQLRYKGMKHPLITKEKLQKKSQERKKKLEEKRHRDFAKRRISRQAILAERKTEKNIIHATKNSGRSNKDGDHVSAGDITLDTKLQTTRDNPIIWVAELEKVRRDAKRAGRQIGALVIRNRSNIGFVVLAESDYAELVKGLIDGTEVDLQIPGSSKASSNVVQGSEYQSGSSDSKT